jgi:hypothetical protein
VVLTGLFTCLVLALQGVYGFRKIGVDAILGAVALLDIQGVRPRSDRDNGGGPGQSFLPFYLKDPTPDTHLEGMVIPFSVNGNYDQ